MSFVPRTQLEILNDMIAYVQTHTELTDFTVGSMIRTILEAASIEDDEQYFQMSQLLDMFSIRNASNEDLERRLAEYNLFRLGPIKAFGQVKFADNSIKTTQASIDVLANSLVMYVLDSNAFPVAGYPFTIRVGEGTPVVQDIDITNNDTGAGKLTISSTTPLTDAVMIGDTVTLVTGATTRVINVGTVVEAPATVITPTKKYTTQERATIVAGNVFSNKVKVQANVAGVVGNTGANTITKISGGSPFPGAAVINTDPVEGGRSTEKDADFKSRGLSQLQALSKGTALAIKSSVTGVTDSTTGQRVVSANIVEDFVGNLVTVYIDDGTGFDPDTVTTGYGSLGAALVGGEVSFTLVDTTNLPSFGWILIEDDIVGSGLAELVQYSEIVNNKVILKSGSIAGPHAINTIVRAVDIVTNGSEVNQRRFKLKNFPIVLSTQKVYSKSGSNPWVLLLENTDYVVNHGTGEVQLVNPLGASSGTKIVASYEYYTNLVALVQRVIEGDIGDPISYPGSKAAGVRVRVAEPTPVYINVQANIVAHDLFLEEDLRAPVRQAISDYINSRKIGENVILMEMVKAAYTVPGLKDIKITNPLTNQVILEDHLPLAQDNDGKSLVTVV